MNAVIILSLCVVIVFAGDNEGHHRDVCVSAGIAEATCKSFEDCMKTASTGQMGQHQAGGEHHEGTRSTPSAAEQSARMAAMQIQVNSCATTAQMNSTALAALVAKFEEGRPMTNISG